MTRGSRTLHALGLAAGWGAGLLWAWRTLTWMRGMDRLSDVRAQRGSPRGRVSVIVPARNEARHVEPCLRSLLASGEIDLEVIAVDDRSEDATGVILDWMTVQPRNPGVRYRAEHVSLLPPGWLGKPHAMHRGVACSTGEWLLFTDADVVFAPDALRRAAAWAEAAEVDHLLLMPTLRAGSPGERMMLPFLQAISIWGPRMWRVADPASSDAAGVGAFNLVRRRAYETVGGWERLRAEVIEDVAMGVLLKRAGFRSTVAVGPGLVCIRWAEGAMGVVSNLTKNVFAAFRFRAALAGAAAVAMSVMCLLPFAGLALGLARRRNWLAPSSLALLSLAAIYQRHRRYTDGAGPASLLWLAAFPVATGLFLYAMVRSTVLTLLRDGVTWRGTFYALPELRRNMIPLR